MKQDKQKRGGFCRRGGPAPAASGSRYRRPATGVADEWPSLTEPGLQPGSLLKNTVMDCKLHIPCPEFPSLSDRCFIGNGGRADAVPSDRCLTAGGLRSPLSPSVHRVPSDRCLTGNGRKLHTPCSDRLVTGTVFFTVNGRKLPRREFAASPFPFSPPGHPPG